MMFMAFHKSPFLTVVQLHNRDKPKRDFFRKDKNTRKASERKWSGNIKQREERVSNSLFSLSVSTGGDMAEMDVGSIGMGELGGLEGSREPLQRWFR